MPEPEVSGRVWTCKIGGSAAAPPGADQPMRTAVEEAYLRLFGAPPAFVFSGWGGELTEAERAVVEDREPEIPAAVCPADPATEWVQRAKRVLEYVSRGAGYRGVEPYPDATARALLGELYDSVRPSTTPDVAQPAGRSLPEVLGAIGDTMTAAERASFAARIVGPAGGHVYLSTGCYHGRHDYCAAMTGYQGTKRPAQCKFCDARCSCDCHACPTCSGPVRETVGMVCQTCGTDYATPASAGEPKATNEDLRIDTEEDR